MPYIRTSGRPHLDEHLKPLANRLVSVGDLSYCLARLFFEFWNIDPCWHSYTDIEGSAQGTLREFYRRVVAPHENGKLSLNGEVFKPYEEEGKDEDSNTDNLPCGCNKR